MIIPAGRIASVGLNKDLPAQQLKLDAWTDVRNARFIDSVVRSAFAYANVTTPLTPITWIDFFRNPTNQVGAFASPASVYGFDADTMADITRVSGGYTGELFDFWQGDMFNGFGVINNGIDVPQIWNPVDPATKLIDMPAWPATVRAKVVRGFGNFLVALDIIKSGTRDIRRVKWSHSADPNTLPSSWDETDAAKDAGEQSLAQGQDGLVDCLIFGEANLIYSELQTWAMTYVGGQSVFAFRNVFPSSGILAQGCAKTFNAGHFVVTQDDIIVHNTSSMNSVADGATRRWFFDTLSSDYNKLTRVVRYQQQREMWICFPSYGAVLDMALIWNWRDNTWTIRELPNVRSAASVLQMPVPTGDTWDIDDITWDSESTQVWGQPINFKEAETIVLAGSDTDLYTIKETLTTDVPVRVERTGIALVEPDVPDEYSFKHLIAVRPSISATPGTVVTITVGHQDTIQSTVVWDASGLFTVGLDVELALNAVGRYIAIKFEWMVGSQSVHFFGYGLDMVLLKESL